jgi:hypothetical protein
MSSKRRFNWKIFFWLMVASRLAAVASVPYIKTLTRSPPAPLSVILLGACLQAVITAVLVGIGLWTRESVELGASRLWAMPAGHKDGKRRFLTWLPLSVGAGIAVGIVLLQIDLVSKHLTPAILQPPIPPPMQGFLAAFNGAINQELWMRLGVMTILVRVGMLKSPRSRPSLRLIWTANLLAALAYGTAHLRLAATIAPLNTAVVASVLLGNGLAGVVFGWLYWRVGLLAAMVAHWSTDIVLHVVIPSLHVQ